MSIYSNKKTTEIEGNLEEVLLDLSMVIYALIRGEIPEKIIKETIEKAIEKGKKANEKAKEKETAKKQNNDFVKSILKDLGIEV